MYASSDIMEGFVEKSDEGEVFDRIAGDVDGMAGEEVIRCGRFRILVLVDRVVDDSGR